MRWRKIVKDKNNKNLEKVIEVLLEKIQMLEDEIIYLSTEREILLSKNVELEQRVEDLKEKIKVYE